MIEGEAAGGGEVPLAGVHAPLVKSSIRTAGSDAGRKGQLRPARTSQIRPSATIGPWNSRFHF